MEIKKRNPVLSLSIIVLSGAIMLFLSVLIFNSILKGVFGPYAFQKGMFSMENFTESLSTTDAKVAILYSKITENMLPPGSTWLNENVNVWQKFLAGYKFTPVVIKDEDIENGKLKDFTVLILPSAKAMSDKQMLAIKKFLEDGKSIFATSGTASFTDDGKWRGWDFLQEVFGCTFTKEIDKTIKLKLNTLRGGFPISANIPTGYTMKVATWDNLVAVQVLDPRTTQLSFWYDYRISDGLVREEIKKSSGVLYGTYGKGRFVWYGFDLVAVIGQQEDYVVFDKLVKNSMMWLTYQPIAFIRDWPGTYDAAAIVLPTIAEEPENIRNLIPILRAEKIKPTYLIQNDFAVGNADLTRQLAQSGEIAAITDIGFLASIEDTVNHLHDLNAQIADIANVKKSITNAINDKIFGIKPTNGFFDDNTLHALAQSGLKYVITDSLTDRSVPKHVIKGEKSLITITKTARDDKEIVGENYLNLSDTSFQLYTYKEDVDRVLFEGGLYVLKLHTNYQCKPEYVGVVGDLLKYIRSKNFWMTSTSELYDWWVNKNKIELRVEPRGKRRVVIAVSNVGDVEVKEFFVPVGFQTGVIKAKLKLSSEIIGTVIPEWNYDESTRIMKLKIKDLKPGQSRIYYIDYDVAT